MSHFPSEHATIRVVPGCKAVTNPDAETLTTGNRCESVRARCSCAGTGTVEYLFSTATAHCRKARDESFGAVWRMLTDSLRSSTSVALFDEASANTPATRAAPTAPLNRLGVVIIPQKRSRNALAPMMTSAATQWDLLGCVVMD